MSAKRRILGGLGAALYGLGVPEMMHKQRIVIVAFHRVNEQTAGDPLTVSPTVFRQYCEFFAQYFSVISLSSLLDGIDAGQLPPRPLVITFDDGYADNAEVAAPILKELGLPATFFIASGYVGTQRVAPWDSKIDPPLRWMDWDAVRSLDADGFELGAHTVNHVDLGRVEGDEARREISDSRETVAAEIGHDIDLFAYPFGAVRHLAESNRALVRELGFRCCLSCHGGTNEPAADRFRLQRVPVSEWYLGAGHLGFDLATGRA